MTKQPHDFEVRHINRELQRGKNPPYKRAPDPVQIPLDIEREQYDPRNYTGARVARLLCGCDASRHIHSAYCYAKLNGKRIAS